MRTLCTLLLISLMPITAAAEEFPYRAYVIAPDAKVRSGPGDSFYATNALPWATKVEVYRHDNEEWAAIRPADSSFSWIPRDAVQIDHERGLGVVTVDKVKTRIGSQIGNDFEAEYVTLQRGDVVEILGTTELNDVPHIKIAPPAGEFRWLALTDLSRRPPSAAAQEVASWQAVENGPDEMSAEKQISLTSGSDDRDGPQLGPNRIESSDPDGDNAISQQDTPHGEKIVLNQFASTLQSESIGPDSTGSNSTGSDSTGSDSIGPDSDDELTDGLELLSPPPIDESELSPIPLDQKLINDSPSANLAPELTALPESNATTPPTEKAILPTLAQPRRPIGPVARMRLEKELTELELLLTQIVAMPPQAWKFEELRSRATAVIDTSDDAGQRHHAQRLLAKMAQLDDVRRRQRTLMAKLPAEYRRQRGVLASDQQRELLANSQYDATGWLMPVVTERKDIPKYVLTDEDGNVLRFISPKPGVNLKRFEQKKIGIFGPSGFLPTYNEPHIMAERIVPLGDAPTVRR